MKKLAYGLTTLFLLTQGSWGMWEEEEQSSTSFTTTKTQQSKLKVVDPVDILPGDLLINISAFLEANDLGKLPQLSKKWQVMANMPELWKHIGLTKYGDYLTQEDLSENPKQKVVHHYLSILVNAKEKLGEINQLVRKYSLFSYLDCLCHKVNLSFSGYSCNKFEFFSYNNLEFLINLIENSEDFEKLYAQGNEGACHKKISSLIQEGATETAIELNEILIKRGNSKAIERKLNGLKEGGRKYALPAHPYSRPPYRFDSTYYYQLGSIRNLQERSASYGYVENRDELRKFIEYLVLTDNPEGIKQKLIGLMNGTNGYDMDPKAAREFNEELVEKDDPDAIDRKILSLSVANGYGYDKDEDIARELNESLVQKGDPRAIERKYEGLRLTRYGYKSDKNAAKRFNDDLAEKGDQEAIERKIEGLIQGKTNFHVYDKDPQAAVELNEGLILRGNIRAIFRKILGFHRGEYGYKQDAQHIREFIEDLSTSSVPAARGIGRYLKVFALKYGVLGYERNRQEAMSFISEFNVPF